MRNLYARRVRRIPVHVRRGSTPWGLIAVLFAMMISMVLLMNHMDDQLCAAVEAGDAPVNSYTNEICN